MATARIDAAEWGHYPVSACKSYGVWFHYPPDPGCGAEQGWILKITFGPTSFFDVPPVVGPPYMITPGVDVLSCQFGNAAAEQVISDWVAGFGPFGMAPFDLAQLASTLLIDGLTDEGELCA